MSDSGREQRRGRTNGSVVGCTRCQRRRTKTVELGTGGADARKAIARSTSPQVFRSIGHYRVPTHWLLDWSDGIIEQQLSGAM